MISRPGRRPRRIRTRKRACCWTRYTKNTGKGDQKQEYDYGSAIHAGFDYLLKNYPEVFVLGQGLWSPWYVGNTMTDLDKVYGAERVIDTPVSEAACTGAAVGASLAGMRTIVVHPRMDFMLYGLDAIVNQAAKWSHMFGGQAHPAVTIRGSSTGAASRARSIRRRCIHGSAMCRVAGRHALLGCRCARSFRCVGSV